jgi:hypothetical protein
MLGVFSGEYEALDPVHGARQLRDRRLQTVDVEGFVSLNEQGT